MPGALRAVAVLLDAAGQYADNLLHYLYGLAAEARRTNRMGVAISCGDPERNKNYRVAYFGKKKSDPVEAAPILEPRRAARRKPAGVGTVGTVCVP